MNCKILFFLLFFAVSGQLQSQNTMQTAVDIGSKSASFVYANTQSTLNSGNNYGRSTNDVFHKFTLTQGMEIIISHCGSGLNDTYLYLLNSSGGLIASNDDSSVACSNYYQSYLKIQLAAGVYYIVSEGYSSNGSITVSVEGIAQTSCSQDQNYIRTTTYLNETGTDLLETIQYFDGLGRLVQTVLKGAGGNREDLVTFQEYDAFGRESNAWLPRAAANNNGAFVALNDFKNLPAGVYQNDAAPYSKPVYEPSPLSRVVEQYGPGAAWHNNSKSVKTQYLTNEAITNNYLDCNYYKLTSGNLQKSGKYAAGQLFVTKTNDEDGKNITCEFKDKLGRVVLVRQRAYSDRLDTYYVYDDFGNLCYVLPPMASDALAADATWTPSNVTLQDYAYMYEYDYRNRCIKKKLPGADSIVYVYDKADRLILTQDGEQRYKNPGQWSITKYDALGRVIYTGLVSNVTNQDRENVRNGVITETYTGNSAGNMLGYTCTYFVGRVTPLTANYYDNYDFFSLNFKIGYGGYYEYLDSFKSEFNSYYGNSSDLADPKGLLTGSADGIPDFPGNYNITFFYYNYKGEVIQKNEQKWMVKAGTYSNNSERQAFVKNSYKYNFRGQLLKCNTNLEYYNMDATNFFYETCDYEYDHAGREKKMSYYGYDYNYNYELIYDEKNYDELGRLASKKTNNNANFTVGYSYDLRNRLTGISNPLFSQTLQYNYNGDISKTTEVNGSNSRATNYYYDEVSRLISCNGSEKMSCAYDKNGNIMYFYRGTPMGYFDDVGISYKGNQVMDYSTYPVDYDYPYKAKEYSFDQADYSWNKNGAMTKDLNNGISEIKYNLLNLPVQVDIKSPLAEARQRYIYSATGERINSYRRWNSSYSTNPLIGSAVNESSLNYFNEVIYMNNKEFSSSDELLNIYFDGGFFSYVDCAYFFYIKDHQGNIRVVADKNGNVIQRTNYYAFGMTADGSTNQSAQPYKYNSHEFVHQDGLNLYNYGARWYNPAIARFTTQDPLAEKYYNISPYAYCANNPMRFIDPDGRDVWEINDAGEIVNHIKDKTQDAFYMVAKDADGNYQRTKTTDADGNEIDNGISFEYGTVTSVQEKKVNTDAGEQILTMFNIKGDDKATQFFEFMANPTVTTNVEWSHDKIGTEKSQGNIVGTMHHKSRTAQGYYLNSKGYSIREDIHSHPQGTDPNRYDFGIAGMILEKNKKTLFNVYNSKTKVYIPYNDKGVILK